MINWSTNVKDNRRTSSASIRHESLSSEIQRSWGAIFYHSFVIAIISIVALFWSDTLIDNFHWLDVSPTITIMSHNWVNGRHHQLLWSTTYLVQNIRFPLNIIILYKRLSMCWRYIDVWVLAESLYLIVNQSSCPAPVVQRREVSWSFTKRT